MSEISRRHFVEGTGAGLVAAKVIPPLQAQQAPVQARPLEAVPHAAINLTVNGVERRVQSPADGRRDNDSGGGIGIV